MNSIISSRNNCIRLIFFSVDCFHIHEDTRQVVNASEASLNLSEVVSNISALECREFCIRTDDCTRFIHDIITNQCDVFYEVTSSEYTNNTCCSVWERYFCYGKCMRLPN